MKLTKYAHACLFIEDESGSRLVIDPGSFTLLPEVLTDISLVVVTEEHFDHFSLENIQKILEASPGAKIFTTNTVAKKLAESNISARTVVGTQTEMVGPFKLTLKVVEHAPVYKSSPCESITTRVNEFLYYPSDSYETTDATVSVLALPTSGPWHKLSEAIDFANSVDAKTIVATHNGLYNQTGNQVSNNFIEANITDKTRTYVYLQDGESL